MTVNGSQDRQKIMIESWKREDRRVESPNAQSEIVSSDEETALEGDA